MIEDAQRLFDYLPLEHKSKPEGDYVDFLWEAFKVNYENEKYQFAYIAYHMLFMCFVYFQLAKIYLNAPDEIRQFLIFVNKAQSAVDNYEVKYKEALQKKLDAPQFNPFSLSEENERTIVGLFVAIGCNRETIKRLRKIVDERNNIAHSNGNINFSSQDYLDEKIEEILACVDQIDKKTAPIITACTEKFLLGSATPEENEYIDENDQVREVLIKGNYFSSNDMEMAGLYPIDKLEHTAEHPYIQKLFQAILEAIPQDEYDVLMDMCRDAAIYALESRLWDGKSSYMTLMDVPGEQEPVKISSYEELENCLGECIETVYYSNEPQDKIWSGNFSMDDARFMAREVLSDYEQQLASFFPNQSKALPEEGG
jgi:hypothetical protein